jgi:predicted enzyme related to lactoylglutathione lyase
MEFTGICLVTDDVPALARFYAALTGAAAEGDDTHVELRGEGAGIALISTAGMEALAPGAMQGAGRGNCTFSFRVQDADAEYERVKALGATLVKPLQTHPWGARSFWFRDPDGNIVSFYAVRG